MPLDFPNDPVAGDIFADAGARWQWDGFKWTSLMTSGGPFLPLSGGALTGPLVLAADPVAALHAATKQYVDGHSGGSGYLPLTGGTLTGSLMLTAMSTVIPPAGVGLLQGHTVNGTVIQGNGSTNDFMLNNKNGAAVLSVPTGTTNLTTAALSTLTVNQGTVVAKFATNYPYTTQALGGGATLNSPLSYLTTLSGTVTGGNTVLYSLQQGSLAVPETLNIPGGGISCLNLRSWTGGAGASGNRVLLNMAQNVSGAITGATYISGLWSYSTVSASNGGTSGAAKGQQIGGVISANLASGAMFYAECAGLEVDAGISAGASANYKNILKLVLGLDDVAATLANNGLTIAQAAGGSSPGLDHLITFGSATGIWAANTTSGVLIGAVPTSLGGNAYQAAYGIKLDNVTFTTAFLQSTGFTVDGAGNVTAAGFVGGIHLGSVLAASASDFSKHLDLYGGVAGINMTTALATNYVARSGGSHQFYSGATQIAFVSPTGLNIVAGAARLGSRVATGGVTDLSQHLDLYGGAYGLSVTAGRLNYVVGASTAHTFVVNAADIVSIGSTGLRVNGNAGFNNTAPIAKPTVSGAKASNAALASLIAALASYGLITDTTTA